MINLDDAFLEDVGLKRLPAHLKKAMLQHVYDTLEIRVGTALAGQMTDAQLDEFEQFIDDNGDEDESEALEWLNKHIPDYKDVVDRILDELKVEIRQSADSILEREGIVAE